MKQGKLFFRQWPFFRVSWPSRRQWRWCHGVLGLLAGGVLVVVAGTGALLTFEPEMSRLMVPEVSWNGTDVVAWTVIRSEAERRRPGHQLQMIWFPNESRPFYAAAFAIGGREYTDPLTFHPATGEVIEVSEGRFFETVESLHESLLLGAFGEWLVGWSTLAVVPLLVTGLWLWWPGWRLQRWIKVGKGRRWVFDLHQLVGWTTAIFILLMAFSGLVWAFPGVLEPAVYAVTGSPMPETNPGALWQLKSVPPAREGLGDSGVGLGDAAAREADPQRMLELALERAPEGSFPFYLSFPIFPEEVQQVRLQRGYVPYPRGEVSRFYFDRYSGELLGEDLPTESAAAQYLSRWNYALHVGSWGGWPMRVLYLLACVGMVFLSVTGVVLWVRRQGRQRPQTIGG